MRSLSAVALLSILSCAGTDSDPVAIRLVDEFPRARVESVASPDVEAIPRTEWRFIGGRLAWQAGPGVADLEVRDGRLTGRTTSDQPVIHVERTSGLDDDDVLHEVVIRMRVSEGNNLNLSFVSQQELELEPILDRARTFGWTLTTPILPGDEVETYRIDPATAAFEPSFPSSSIRHIVLSPTDAEGAEFAIESVRLVFRREHLASIPPGVSWQGLGDVFRETIVSRSPERVELDLELPDRPRLEIALGTVEDGPVTFAIAARPAGEEEEIVLRETTITTPNRWKEVYENLDGLGGRSVTLSLSLRAEGEGAIGFWGSPAVRSRWLLPHPDAPQGVVLVLLDTLRRDHLEAYGYERETAPHVSRLARQGVLLRDAIAQGAWTKVSVPSLLTSTYPTSNGIVDFVDRVPASAVTLAEVFRQAGYATWHSSSVPFTGRLSNLHQGVEVLHERASIDLPEAQESSKTARAVADRLLPWLEAHREVPFFVVFHALDPHSDYRPYRPYDTMWAKPGARDEHERWVETVRPFIESSFMKRLGLPTRDELEEAGVDPEAFVELELDWYDGSIRAADAEVGRILEKLRGLGLDEGTLVVVTSDHGEEFLDHGGHFHEENVYGELVNVPLILRWPGVLPAGKVVEETVELVDLGPTMVELAGLDVPERMQGDSLVALLEASEEGAAWRPLPAISEWEKRQDQLGSEIVDARSIILDSWKLVHNVDRPEGVPEYELYDHRNDPLDQNDVASEHPEVVERLASQLERWHRWALEHRLPSDEEMAEGVSSEELERLRSLGYIK